MRLMVFVAIIIACSAFFALFLITDELYVLDRGLQQVYESALLAVTLAAVGITASRYYGDTTADATIRELKRIESKFEQMIEDLDSKIDGSYNNKKTE